MCDWNSLAIFLLSVEDNMTEISIKNLENFIIKFSENQWDHLLVGFSSPYFNIQYITKSDFW
jgi:hypothetical protein